METALEQLINSPLPHRFVTAFITAVKEGGAQDLGPCTWSVLTSAGVWLQIDKLGSLNVCPPLGAHPGFPSRKIRVREHEDVLRRIIDLANRQAVSELLEELGF